MQWIIVNRNCLSVGKETKKDRKGAQNTFQIFNCWLVLTNPRWDLFSSYLPFSLKVHWKSTCLSVYISACFFFYWSCPHLGPWLLFPCIWLNIPLVCWEVQTVLSVLHKCVVACWLSVVHRDRPMQTGRSLCWRVSRLEGEVPCCTVRCGGGGQNEEDTTEVTPVNQFAFGLGHVIAGSFAARATDGRTAPRRT